MEQTVLSWQYATNTVESLCPLSDYTIPCRSCEMLSSAGRTCSQCDWSSTMVWCKWTPAGWAQTFCRVYLCLNGARLRWSSWLPCSALAMRADKQSILMPWCVSLMRSRTLWTPMASWERLVQVMCGDVSCLCWLLTSSSQDSLGTVFMLLWVAYLSWLHLLCAYPM